MARMGRPKNAIKSKRFEVRLSTKQRACLAALAEIGIHGKNSPEVAVYFIVRGIAEAFGQGILKREVPTANGEKPTNGK